MFSPFIKKKKSLSFPLKMFKYSQDLFWSLPWWLSKESTCNAGNAS